jgi:hypothetical protein
MPNGEGLYSPYSTRCSIGFWNCAQWQDIHEQPHGVKAGLVMRNGMGGPLDRIRTALRIAFPAGANLIIEALEKISTNPGEKRKEIPSHNQTGQGQS